MLPEPKARVGPWWPDWWVMQDAVQRGVFTLTDGEARIVEAFLHGYRPTQIREWFPSHAAYDRTLRALRRRWQPMEESLSQLAFPPWGGSDPAPARLYEEVSED